MTRAGPLAVVQGSTKVWNNMRLRKVEQRQKAHKKDCLSAAIRQKDILS
jgi:hypothetical protein